MLAFHKVTINFVPACFVSKCKVKGSVIVGFF